MIRALVLGGCAAFTLSACATQAPLVHTRTGVSEAQLFSDSEACRLVATGRGAAVPGAPATANPALPSQAGAALGAGLAEGFARARAEKVGYERCMSERGYLQTTLTDAEYREFRALKAEDARKSWLGAFAAREHGARATPAPAPKPCKSNMLVRCTNPS